MMHNPHKFSTDNKALAKICAEWTEHASVILELKNCATVLLLLFLPHFYLLLLLPSL